MTKRGQHKFALVAAIFALISASFLTTFLATGSAANDETTPEDAARAKVVNYMREAASIRWTPQKDIPYWTKSQPFTFKAGETYYGVPYTQLNRDYDLDKFQALLENVGGVATYVGPSESNTYAGNDCSSATSHAWRRIDPSFPTLNTDAMLPNREKRIVKAGDYEIGAEKTTIEIVKRNGEAVVKKAYASLKPGDAVLYRGKTGHVMVVLKNAPEEEKLYIADQTGCDEGTPMGQGGRSTMRVDHEISYDRLFKTNYIPIRLKAIDDLAKQSANR